MQSGMLYHSLTGQDYDMYFMSAVFKLEGKIEKFLLEESFNRLIGDTIFTGQFIFIIVRSDRCKWF